MRRLLKKRELAHICACNSREDERGLSRVFLGRKLSVICSNPDDKVAEPSPLRALKPPVPT